MATISLDVVNNSNEEDDSIKLIKTWENWKERGDQVKKIFENVFCTTFPLQGLSKELSEYVFVGIPIKKDKKVIEYANKDKVVDIWMDTFKGKYNGRIGQYASVKLYKHGEGNFPFNGRIFLIEKDAIFVNQWVEDGLSKASKLQKRLYQ